MFVQRVCIIWEKQTLYAKSLIKYVILNKGMSEQKKVQNFLIFHG